MQLYQTGNLNPNIYLVFYSRLDLQWLLVEFNTNEYRDSPALTRQYTINKTLTLQVLQPNVLQLQKFELILVTLKNSSDLHTKINSI